MKKYISHLLLLLFFTQIFFPHGFIEDTFAISVDYDFETPWDYTISDTNTAYIHGWAAKLKGSLAARWDIENGPVAMDWATNVIVDGNYAYVTWYGAHAVTSVDISDPTNMSGAWYIGAYGIRKLNGAYDLKKVGNFIYVASYIDDDLHIIDASDPTNLTHEWWFVDTGTSRMNGIRGIDVVGNFAYLAAYQDDALQIIDISNPAAPVERGNISDASRLNGATSVKVVGNYAYVTSYTDDSLQIIDISDPDNPVFAGEIVDDATTELNGAWWLDVVWNYAYVASYNDDGLEIIDISTPTAPVHVWEIQNSDPWVFLNGAREIEVIWNYAYVSAYVDDSLEIIDISTPSAPSHVGSLDTNSFWRLDWAFGIAVDWDDVYMTSYANGTLQSIDATTKTAPVFQDELESGPIRLWNAVWVKVEGDYAYVASYGSNGLEILDISDSANPTHVSSLTDNSANNELFGSWDLEKDGDYIYVSWYSDGGIEVIDVSDPASPTSVASIVDSPTVELQNPRWLAIEWNFLYVTSYNGDSLQIFDITTPSSPVAKGNYKSSTTINTANDVAVVGDYAFVTSYVNDRVVVIDMSDPDNPTFETELVNGAGLELNGPWDIDIHGDFAYITTYIDDAIVVLDVSDPTAPVYMWDLNDNGSIRMNTPRGIVYDQWYAYLSTYADDSVVVVDVSDPTAPLYIDEIRNTNLYRASSKIAKQGNDLFFTQYVWSSFAVVRESYSSNSPFIIPNTAISSATIGTISETQWTYNQGNITFQLSKDNGTTWYYFNGTSWVTTVWWTAQSNSSSIINANASSFNAIAGGTNQIKWKAFLNSDGTQKVELEHILVDTDPPTPWAVATNLELWLKADAWTSTTTDGAALSTWDDQSWNGLDASAVVTPDYRNNNADNLNFNPVVDFNGINDYMSNTANGVFSDSYIAVIVPDNTIDGTVTWGVPFWLECNNVSLSSGTCALPFGWVVLGQFTGAIPDEVVTHAFGSSANWRSAQTGVSSYEWGRPMMISVNENAAANGTDIYEKWLKIDDTTTNTYQTLSSTDYSLWRTLDNVNTFYYDGKVAEIINYSGRLSDTDRQRIESYLAIKYGMTLDSGTKDYIASDGTTVFWDASSVWSYTHRVFGIGRDDAGALWQVQSKAEDDSAIVTIEANGEGTNTSPNFIDISNKEFLMISDNAWANSWTSVWAPSGYDILWRKWRIEETGDTGTIKLSFDVDDTDFNVPALNAGTNYYVVYDTDGDGVLDDETPTTLSNTSGSIWEIASINPSDNRIFTLVTETSSNNIPTNISLSASSINENVTAGSIFGTLSTTDADLWDSHVYSLVSWAWDDDNGDFTIVGNMLNIAISPDYEIKNTYTIRVETDDGNWGTFQKVFPLSINDLSETLSSIIDFETPGKYTVTSWTWNRTTNNPQQWSFSIESDNGWVANTQSCFEVTHTHSSTGSIDFYYEVSSQAWGDFLRFYFNDVEQQTWSGTVPYAQYTLPNIAPWTHDYKWCYTKNGATNTGTDNAFVDYITFPSGLTDVVPPNIISSNFASGALLPWGNHNITINYEDTDSGIDTATDSLQLQKWDGISAWWTDISGTSIGTPTVWTGSATYPTTNLSFWKYRYTFSIDDNAGNTSTVARDFYIDEPELIIGSGAIDMWEINHLWTNFSDTVTLEVRTVWAAFDLTFSNSTLPSYSTESIPEWDGTEGYGYQQAPYSGSLSAIWTGQVIASQGELINTNGNRNSYSYDIQIWALVDILQAWGEYIGDIKFDIALEY